jgi:hypothetical protein
MFSMALKKEVYEVAADAFVAGKRRAKGERVEMTEGEAQFLVLDGLVAKVAAEPPKPSKGAKAN